MNSAVRRQARGAAFEVADTAPDVTGLLKGTAAALRRALPVEGWCGFTLDPATLVKTAGVHESGLSPTLFGRLFELEYRHDDVNGFADLARGGSPAAILAEASGRRPESSARFREILRPTGYAHELRLVLLDRGRAWGGFVFLRERRSAPFTTADSRFVAELSHRLARGVRRALLRSQLGGRQGSGLLPDHPGVLLLDDAYRIESMTPGAEALLATLIDDAPSPAPLPAAVLALAAKAREGETTSLQLPTHAGIWATMHGWRLPAPAKVALSIQRSRPEDAAAHVLGGYGLSEREGQIAGLLLAGYSAGQVAGQLYLSPHTVRDYVKSIFGKTGTRNRHELVSALFFRPYR
ncbi:response regulator transcription factor [Nonomuraea sp. NPDC002799]